MFEINKSSISNAIKGCQKKIIRKLHNACSRKKAQHQMVPLYGHILHQQTILVQIVFIATRTVYQTQNYCRLIEINAAI